MEIFEKKRQKTSICAGECFETSLSRHLRFTTNQGDATQERPGGVSKVTVNTRLTRT